MKNTISFKLSGLYKYIPIFFLVLTLPAFAQVEQSTPSGEQYNFTLQQAIDYAVAHQVSILNARIDETIADKKIREIVGSGLPQINGSVEVDDYLAKPVSIVPGSFFGQPGHDIAVSFLKQYQASPGISASQLIFSGTFLVGLQAAQTYADLSKKFVKQSQIDVVANVTKAYYGVIINEKNLVALDSTISLLQKTLNDAKAMYTQGFIEKLDVDRITVTLSNLQSSRQNLRSIVDADYYFLKFQMGMAVNASLTLTDKLPNEFPAPVIESADFNKRIEYDILQTGRKLDAFSVKVTKAGYLPSLVAFGSLSTVAYRDQFDFLNTRKSWYPTGVIGLKLSVPIFDGGQKSAIIQQANMVLMKDQNTINNFGNLVDLQVKQASISYESSYKILQSQKDNLKLAEDVARVTKIKYEDGVGTNLEVIDAESQLVSAQNNYYNALYSMGIAHVDLQRAKGILY